MGRDQIGELRRLEGQRVSFTLRDGSRIEGCELVSVGHGTVATAWLCHEGRDQFVELSHIIEFWDPRSPRRGRRAA